MNRIPPAILHTAQTKLDEAADILKPYFGTLSSSGRRILDKMGPDSIKFLEMSYELALGNPEFFPGSMNIVIFGEDLSAVRELMVLAAKLNQLKHTISDIEITTGGRALEAALAFYQTLKIAAWHDIPGTRIIYDELKELKLRRPSGVQGKPKKQKNQKSNKNRLQPELFES